MGVLLSSVPAVGSGPCRGSPGQSDFPAGRYVRAPPRSSRRAELGTSARRPARGGGEAVAAAPAPPGYGAAGARREEPGGERVAGAGRVELGTVERLGGHR